MICVNCLNKKICNVYDIVKDNLGDIDISINSCKYYSEHVQTLEPIQSQLKPQDTLTSHSDYNNIEDKIRSFYPAKEEEKICSKCGNYILDEDNEQTVDIETGDIVCGDCWVKEEESDK